MFVCVIFIAYCIIHSSEWEEMAALPLRGVHSAEDLIGGSDWLEPGDRTVDLVLGSDASPFRSRASCAK